MSTTNLLTLSVDVSQEIERFKKIDRTITWVVGNFRDNLISRHLIFAILENFSKPSDLIFFQIAKNANNWCRENIIPQVNVKFPTTVRITNKNLLIFRDI